MSLLSKLRGILAPKVKKADMPKDTTNIVAKSIKQGQPLLSGPQIRDIRRSAGRSCNYTKRRFNTIFKQDVPHVGKKQLSKATERRAQELSNLGQIAG